MAKDEQMSHKDRHDHLNQEEMLDDIYREDLLEGEMDMEDMPTQEAEEAPPVPAAQAALMRLLYDRTAASKVSGAKWLKAQKHADIPPEELDSLLASIREGSAPPALATIRFVPMGKENYYYDSAIMTDHFAELDAMIEEKDILHTIASVTRSDCSLYPRPTQFSKMMAYPFRFTLDEVEGAAARMQLSDDYQDIQVVTASNGAKAFYSTLHMSKGYASGLLEDIEVNEKLFP